MLHPRSGFGVEGLDVLWQCRTWWLAQTIKVDSEKKSSPPNQQAANLSNINTSSANINVENVASTQIDAAAASWLPFLHESVAPVIRSVFEKEATLLSRALNVENDQARIGFPNQVSEILECLLLLLLFFPIYFY
jgi:hypothetical protein